MSAKAPVLRVPEGTVVSQRGARVTIDFLLPSEADAFCEWLSWVNDQTSPRELVLTQFREPRQ